MSGLVHHFLEQSADQYGAKTALVCGAQRLTYLQVEQQANQAANALRARGIQRGDRVALFMPNSAELVCALFAVLKAGAVFVIINPTTKTDKLAYILNNCQARANQRRCPKHRGQCHAQPGPFADLVGDRWTGQ